MRVIIRNSGRFTMADDHGFRFLDLPKDIRLEIYDLFPAETRRYTVQARTPGITPFTLVFERIPCMALLTTCRQIFHEVSAIMGSRLEGQPLRIFAAVRDLSNTVVKVLSYYTAPQSQQKFLEIRVKRYSPSRETGPDDQDVPEYPPQALYHNIRATGSKLEVEIALELGDVFTSSPWYFQLTRDYIRIFHERIMGMGKSQWYHRHDPVNITIRPKPTADMSEKTISDCKVFEFEEYQRDFGLGKMWTCQFGECMTEREWQRNWEEGKHFRKLKRI
ncbi:uncharacterized protein J4E92_009871 [Alternaria infectoria]|uniref:uncharacterized protein n=1 Tax=Alternaria infectoria TaxID=45303 RepID=UPI002220AFA9|nr:uncharacterized protein J4E92_009871 [Alternaria infectoria]KAI4913248.1 hypothetical protein J4E92_009871 [Alternaria infectoria]